MGLEFCAGVDGLEAVGLVLGGDFSVRRLTVVKPSGKPMREPCHQLPQTAPQVWKTQFL